MTSDPEPTATGHHAATRDRVLEAVRTAAAPPTVEEIARHLGLHRNSVRLHAAALQDDGLITQDSRPSGGRGRPQVTYRTSSTGAWTGRRDYRLLASLLLSELHETDDADGEDSEDDERAAPARRLGQAWGQRVAAEPTADPAASGARQRVVSALDQLGFEPATHVSPTDAAAATPGTDEVELRNCPFRELVEPHDGVVCAIHAGMLDGLVEQDDVTVDLLPFTSPGACTVRLHTP